MTTAERLPASELGRGTATSYAGNADFHRCFCDLLDNAEHEVIDYVIPETRPDEHDKHILRAYGNAVRRGIDCRTLIAPEHLHLVQSTWDPEFDMRVFLEKMTHIRLVEKVNGPFTIVDGRKVLLNIADAEDGREYTTSIVVEDEALAAHLTNTFDRLWDAGAGQQEALLSEWVGRAPGA
ncbi:MAG: hypothetical protein WD557_01020 [Dehalococcoidia bacterium]